MRITVAPAIPLTDARGHNDKGHPPTPREAEGMALGGPIKAVAPVAQLDRAPPS